MMTLEINEQEKQQLMACLDLAVKNGGLQAAAALMGLASKISQLADEKKEVTDG